MLAAWFKGKNFDLILTDAIASDDGNSQVGPALAVINARQVVETVNIVGALP